MLDQRFDRDDYFYGTEPSHFLVAQRDRLRPGQRALVVAEGEGRNAVYLAEQGLAVTALDSSRVALAKAQRLAAERGVEVDFRDADLAHWPWEPEACGGPPCAELLYTPELLREAFAEMEILQLEEYERELQEGSGHAGQAALIDLVARLPVAAEPKGPG